MHREYGSLHKNDNKVLQRAGTRYKVKRIDRHSDGDYYIEIEETGVVAKSSVQKARKTDTYEQQLARIIADKAKPRALTKRDLHMADKMQSGGGPMLVDDDPQWPGASGNGPLDLDDRS